MLILGSKSPRRKEILEMVKIPFKIILKDVVEDIDSLDPIEYVLSTSLKKAQAIIEEVNEDDIVLCCDTIVYIDNLILGKPKDKNAASEMIKRIQGKTHSVLTGVYLGNKISSQSFYEKTEVTVSKMSDNEIEEYINTKEPYDKAGGYAIQGIFGKFIERIQGDFYNVMGLPINHVYQVLKSLNKKNITI